MADLATKDLYAIGIRSIFLYEQTDHRRHTIDVVLRISKHVACLPIKCMLSEGVVTPTRALHSIRYLSPSPPPRALISISLMTYIFREPLLHCLGVDVVGPCWASTRVPISSGLRCDDSDTLEGGIDTRQPSLYVEQNDKIESRQREQPRAACGRTKATKRASPCKSPREVWLGFLS